MYALYREEVISALKAVNPERVEEAARVLQRAGEQNANVYILGNGGSAATASHLANDLLKMCGIHAMALSDLSPTVLAYGNDEGWDEMYAAPLRKLLLPQDVVIGISCSGNSPNVVSAIRMVKNISLPGLRTIILTGADFNCELSKLIPTVIIYVPYKDIRVQEDCHLVICHAMAGSLAYGHTQR